MFKDFYKSVFEYINKTKYIHILLFIIFLFLYSSWLGNNIPVHIDSANLINEPYTDALWLSNGRFGGIFTDFVFGLRWYNPLFTSLLGLTTAYISGAIISFFIYKLGNTNIYLCSLFGFLYFLYPTFAEQFYFVHQIFRITFAFILSFLASGIFIYGFFKHNKIFSLITFLCILWSISTYQVFVFINFTSFIFLFILYLRRLEYENKVENNKIIHLFLQYMLIFICALLIYCLLYELFFHKISYIDNQVKWSQESYAVSLAKILFAVLRGYTGLGIFYSTFYGIFSFIAIILTIIDIRRFSFKYKKTYMISILILQICSFGLTFIIGGIEAYRAFLVYPLVLVFNMIFAASHRYRHKSNIIFIYVLIFISSFSWIKTTSRLIYTDNIRSEIDHTVYKDIEQRLGKASLAGKPLVFVGSLNDYKLTNACIRGDIIGVSVFDNYNDGEPHSFESSKQICDAARAIGIAFKCAKAEQIMNARIFANDMPSYPDNDCIADLGDCVVIKLADDDYSEELLPELKETNIENYSKSSLLFSEPTIENINDNIVIRGCILKQGLNASIYEPEAFLYDTNLKKYYKLVTVKEEASNFTLLSFLNKLDFIYAIKDDKYKYCGYKAVVPSKHIEAEKNYVLLVGLKNKQTNERYIDYVSDVLGK